MSGVDNTEAQQGLYRKDQVVSIINSVVGKMRDPKEVSFELIAAEINGLKDAIESMRKELQVVQPDAINTEHIPSATDELDAVVETTEKATDAIMDSCELIVGDIQGQNADVVQKVEAHIVKIYEACTFQDITGQRIKKVVGALKIIDEKVCHLLETLGTRFAHIQAEGADGAEEKPSLLNGPALPNQGVSQDDIDKILAEFGG